jgi:hypothetical protein
MPTVMLEWRLEPNKPDTGVFLWQAGAWAVCYPTAELPITSSAGLSS